MGVLTGGGGDVALLCCLADVVPVFLTLPGLKTSSTLAGLVGSAFTSGSFLAVASTFAAPGPVTADDEAASKAGGEGGGVELSLTSSTEMDLCQAGAIVKRTLL